MLRRVTFEIGKRPPKKTIQESSTLSPHQKSGHLLQVRCYRRERGNIFSYSCAVQRFCTQQKNTNRQLRRQARPPRTPGFHCTAYFTFQWLHIPKSSVGASGLGKLTPLRRSGGRGGLRAQPRASWKPSPLPQPEPRAPSREGRLSQAAALPPGTSAPRNHMLIAGNPGLSPRVRRFKKDGGRWEGVGGGELSSAERLPGRGTLSQSKGKRGGVLRSNRRPLTAVVALGLAPCCSKTLMMCVWPCWAAWCKGV